MDTAYTDSPRRVSKPDEELLKEIRDRYKAWDDAWKDHRKERDKDISYICGDPWEKKDRDARENAGRPCINHDELNQYTNACVNSVRLNKRGIKADPRGSGSTDQTALLRQDLIRTIEYDCNGPSIYASAFQQMVEGSYAFFRISRRYVSDQYHPEGKAAGALGGDLTARNKSLFMQEICIKAISNPNSVLFDPHCIEPDWSDAKGCFVLERVNRNDFKKQWPKAQVKDFTWEHRQIADGWILDDAIVVAEYWRIETRDKDVWLLDNGRVVEEAGQGGKKRTLAVKEVYQYVTNGVEILQRSEEPEPGSIIPIIPMIGLERYKDEGGTSKRILFSLVRLARDPQLSLAYLTSLEMEEAGLTPKSPFLGYKGQFDSNREMWTSVTKVPHAFLETDIPDNWPAGQVPPLPQRIPFTPNFQQYEIAKDSSRRAIQAAMGIAPLPTAAQRQNEKSGVALERIETMEALGSYHFVDGYDRAIRLAGRVIDQWMPAIYGDEDREVHVRKPDDTSQALRLNTVEPYPDSKDPLKLVRYPVEEVDHAIAISTGPSYDSQRRAVESFLDALIGQMPNLPVTPPQAAQLLSLAIKMRNMGPMGDQMADLIAPQQGDANQTMMQLQQQQMKMQEQEMQLAQLSAIVQQLSIEKQSKIVEGEYKMALEKLRTETNVLIERLKVDAQMAVATINAKDQIEGERAEAVQEARSNAAEQMAEAQKIQDEQEHDMWLARQEYAKQLQEVQEAAAKAAEQAAGPPQ